MQDVRELLRAVGRAYGIIWTVLYWLGSRVALWGGIILIGAYYGAMTFQPLNGLHWMVFWGLFHVSCRIFTNLLPTPSGRRPARPPRERPPPPAVQAVIVAPACTPEACPDRMGMLAQLPPNVRGLIR